MATPTPIIRIPIDEHSRLPYAVGSKPRVDAILARIMGYPLDKLDDGADIQWRVSPTKRKLLRRVARAILPSTKTRLSYSTAARQIKRQRGHELARRIATVRAAWDARHSARENLRALRGAVPHLTGMALVEELRALVAAAGRRRGAREVGARIERIAAYLDPHERAIRRDEAASLREAPYVATSYSPVVRGRAKRYAAHYRGYRVVRAGRTADGRYSTGPRCRSVEVVWDSGAVYDGGERSQGYRAKTFANKLAAHRNILHAVALGKARVTVEHIAAEDNEELRRELIEAYGGFDRYVADAGGMLIHEDETGRLVHIPAAGEPIAVVHVVCPTTGRQYALRVPPSCETAREAVAWTFGLSAEEYRPTMQS